MHLTVLVKKWWFCAKTLKIYNFWRSRTEQKRFNFVKKVDFLYSEGTVPQKSSQNICFNHTKWLFRVSQQGQNRLVSDRQHDDVPPTCKFVEFDTKQILFDSAKSLLSLGRIKTIYFFQQTWKPVFGGFFTLFLSTILCVFKNKTRGF